MNDEVIVVNAVVSPPEDGGLSNECNGRTSPNPLHWQQVSDLSFKILRKG